MIKVALVFLKERQKVTIQQQKDSTIKETWDIKQKLAKVVV